MIRCRNLLISYAKYAIYKFWILSENKKLGFNTASLVNFVKLDIFNSRGNSIYCKNPFLHILVRYFYI